LITSVSFLACGVSIGCPLILWLEVLGAETVLRKSLIGLVAENFEPEDEGTADTDATSEE
jgi:hypothetical protein